VNRTSSFSVHILGVSLFVFAIIIGYQIFIPQEFFMTMGHPLYNCGGLETSNESIPAGDSDVIFSLDRVNSYELCLASLDWEYLQDNALDKEYRKAQLFLNGEWVGEVGLRYKGFNSLRKCFQFGIQTCAKAGMKIKFSEYHPELRLRGLKRLNFNPMFEDKTLMREQLAYQLFRDMGIAAPRTAFCRRWQRTFV
jgi:spore coat protein CotH